MLTSKQTFRPHLGSSGVSRANSWFIYALAVLFAVTGALAACNQRQPLSNPEQAILGKWRTTDGAETAEFTADGLATFENNSAKIAGKYSFIDKGTLKLDLLALQIGKSVQRNVAVYADELVLTDEHGKAMRYRREKG